MLSRICFSFLLVLACSVHQAASPGENLRIQRSGGQTQVKLKPLTGKIDLNVTGALSDKANNYNKQMLGRTDSARLQGGTGEFAGQGQADLMEFHGATRSFDRKPFPLESKRIRLPGDISDRELDVLKSRDVIVMQDRSSSMREKEHFAGSYKKVSRWHWCREQTMDLTRQTMGLPHWGITLVLFSSQYDVYHNVLLSQMPGIFASHRTYVGTRLAEPMAEQLAEYFWRRARGNARPLAISVITDGNPQDEHNLRDVIIEATYRMRDPGEISIVFLQIGTDDDGRKKLRMFDRKLVRKGARYDIVRVIPFYEVSNLGLTRALVNSIKDLQVAEEPYASREQASNPHSLVTPRH